LAAGPSGFARSQGRAEHQEMLTGITVPAGGEFPSAPIAVTVTVLVWVISDVPAGDWESNPVRCMPSVAE